jgi:GTP cyclohydrolase II
MSAFPLRAPAMSTPTVPLPAPFGHPAAIACERAAAELRSGRPLVLHEGTGARTAVLALDGATPASYAAFVAAAGAGVSLFVTGIRARVLGIDAPRGARLEVAGRHFDSLAALAYLPAEGAPPAWTSPTGLDAGAAEIARLGLLLPVLLVHDLEAAPSPFDACAQLSLQELAAGAAHANRDWELVVRTEVPLREVGPAQFVVFRGGVAQRDQVAIIVGQPDLTRPVPVRVHSSCLTGDLFGSLKCDCGDQLRNGLLKLAELGGGVLLYMDQEGRGTGIAAKLRAYGYQHAGMDTIDADALLGFGPDERRYEGAAAMLRGLGVNQVRLLTNNPAKVERLRATGIEVVGRMPVTGRITADNEGYLRTKAARAGHALDVDALIASLS